MNYQIPNDKEKRITEFDKYRNRKPYEYPHVNPNQQVPAPSKVITIADLFPRLDRWGIGIFDTLQHLQAISEEKPAYPPYNIKKFEDGKWRIDMAVAGFRKDELRITVEDRTLTVSSDPVRTELDDELASAEVIHQGIAQRNFNVNFALAEHIEIESAEYADGILTIKLITNIPEEKKPKVIDIN